ncbi:hypothetical protein NJ76_28715, partial [Rhodococcus sp. IITR03]
MRPRGVGEFDGTLEGDVEDLPEFFAALLAEETDPDDAGIGNDDVESTEVVDGSSDDVSCSRSNVMDIDDCSASGGIDGPCPMIVDTMSVRFMQLP